jgi:hypothetical protein
VALMAKYRMDTPKGQVQFVHDQEGTDAARAKAKDLGVGNKIERWLREWAGHETPKKTALPTGDVVTTTAPAPVPRSNGREPTREMLLYHYRNELGMLEARKIVWAEIGCELTKKDERELERLRRLIKEMTPPVSVGRWRSKKKGATHDD